MEKNRWHRTSDEIFDSAPAAKARGFETKKYNIAFHDHDFYEINIVFEGKGTHFIESRKFDACPGDVFVIPPGVLHAYESEDDRFNVFHLIAKNEFFADYQRELGQLSQLKMLLEIEPYLRRQNRKFFMTLSYQQLLAVKQQAAVFSRLEGDNSSQAHVIRTVQTLKLICDLCQYMQENVDIRRDRDYAGILLALDHIHNHYGEKLTVQTLTKLTYLSKATLNRQFQKYCQTSPNAYILAYRCQMAQKYLRLGKSKAQTAQECGFYDQSHMEKMLARYLQKEK